MLDKVSSNIFFFEYNWIYTVMDKINFKKQLKKVSKSTLIRDQLNSLMKVLPGVFGKSAPDNSFKNLFLRFKSNSSLHISSMGQGYKARLLIEGSELADLSFPPGKATFILDQYGNNMWSFTVIFKERGKFDLILEWNNDIHFVSQIKGILVARSLSIILKTHAPHYLPIKRELKVESENGGLITDVVHREIIYKKNIANSMKRLIRFNIQKKLNLLNIKLSIHPHGAGKVFRTNLQIPLRIEFHPN